MPTESVEILIEAEDLASAKFKSVAQQAEASVKRVKEVGERAKKSTEFFGTLANSLGGTQLGGFASQIAALTEKTSQFAEVSKLGAAGAFAFRAGLVAATGAVAFGIGKAIGEVAFQTERLNKELDDSKLKLAQLFEQGQKLSTMRFADRQEDIGLIRDPNKQLEERKRLLQEITKQLSDQQVFNQRQELLVKENALWKWQFGERKMNSDRAIRELEEGKKQLELLHDQQAVLEKQTSERTLANEQLAKQNALQDKSDNYIKTLKDEIELLKAKKSELLLIEAARNTNGVGARNEAAGLLDERDALKALALKDQLLAKIEREVALIEEGTAAVRERDLIEQGMSRDDAAEIAAKEANLKFHKQMADEADAAANKAEENSKRIAGLIEAENDKLREKRVLMEQGPEAAEALRLMNQGVDEANARRIARENALLDKKPLEDTPALQATESRLLTRGTGVDKQLMALLGIKTEAEKQTIALEKFRIELRQQKALRLELVN